MWLCLALLGCGVEVCRAPFRSWGMGKSCMIQSTHIILYAVHLKCVACEACEDDCPAGTGQILILRNA